MKGGSLFRKNKLKNTKDGKLRWLDTDMDFKLLHTWCSVTHEYPSHFAMHVQSNHGSAAEATQRSRDEKQLTERRKIAFPVAQFFDDVISILTRTWVYHC